MDLFAVNYTVRWYRGDDVIGMDTVDELLYTVTGLTNNTSYNVTVAAINTCCGAGPYSDVVMAMTMSPPPGNICCYYVYTVQTGYKFNAKRVSYASDTH